MLRTTMQPAAPAVRYRVELADPAGHYFDVTCTVDEPAADGQTFTLPAWIPGSYMIREFARNIVRIDASTGGVAVSLDKRDKHTWRASPCAGPLTLRYRVYAWDPSVRAAHLDETHAFFNGTSLFLCADGLADRPHAVDLVVPRGKRYRDWRVATTLPSGKTDANGFGSYLARDYDELVDHPVEMGTFRLEAFAAAGVRHEIALTGVVPHLDAARLTKDLSAICAAQIRFFESDHEAKRPKAPFDRYVFLTAVSGDGYGGLEHRASTALVCSRDALPVEGAKDRSAAYRTFLGLASHEYFHTWNVKRIKPAAFAPYDLARENHTSLLWIFEGFTSYYDDLFLVRTGILDRAQYLAELAKTIDVVLAGHGRTSQSVAESSFDAWTKYYRQDENAPNAVVSYYKKGSLVALCLDLHIRRESAGRRSLDDVMRLMWNRYGRDFYPEGRGGLAEDEFPALVQEATGVDVRRPVARWAYGTVELPLDELLGSVGLSLKRERGAGGPALGIKVAASGSDLRIDQVFDGGAAHRAGLSAGDVLVAIDGLRTTPSRLDTLLSRFRPGDTVETTSFRGDVLQRRTLTLEGPPLRSAIVDRAGKTTKATTRACAAWLGES